VLRYINRVFVFAAYLGILINIFLLIFARMNGSVEGQMIAVGNMFLLSFVAFKDIK